MACPVRYPALPCSLSGVGYTAQPVPLGAASIQLQTDHGKQFPVLTTGQFFYADIVDACGDCCETVRVVATVGDLFTVVRDNPTCDCFSSNSRLRYDATGRDAILAIASEAPFNVVEPLVWDCETRTLSIDCAKLQEMVSNPCGGGGGGGGGDDGDAVCGIEVSQLAVTEGPALPTSVIGARDALMGRPDGYMQMCTGYLVPFFRT